MPLLEDRTICMPLPTIQISQPKSLHCVIVCVWATIHIFFLSILPVYYSAPIDCCLSFHFCHFDWKCYHLVTLHLASITDMRARATHTMSKRFVSTRFVSCPADTEIHTYDFAQGKKKYKRTESFGPGHEHNAIVCHADC